MKFMCRIGSHDWEEFSDVIAEMVRGKNGVGVFERRLQRRRCYYCGIVDEREVSRTQK